MNHEALQKSILWSYRALEPFRNLNHALVEEYAGPAYGASGPKEKYLNKLHQAVDAYTLLLAANRPRVHITTHYDQYWGFARKFQEAVNNLIEEIGLEITIRQWVLDAFFCVGVVKVHLAESAPVQFEQDLWMDPGVPFASNVSLDNFFYDMSAKKWSEVKYAGDMYRIPFADIQRGVDEGMYNPEVAENLKPTSKGEVNVERLEAISMGFATDIDEYEPMIDLVDVWVPRNGAIYTYPVSNRRDMTIYGEPLAEMDWDYDHGPYHILGFNDVPENIMPVSPASHLVSLDKLLNNIMRKSARQARRSKENPIYTPAGAESARKIQRTGDGDWVEVDNVQEIGSFKSGGVDPTNQAFASGLLQMFDQQAGNLTALLGLGAQSDTATQEQLIHSAGSRKIGQMQYRVMDATTKLVRSLGLLLWEDNFKTITSTIPLPGLEKYQVDATWKPGDREGDFIDYNFRINPVSMPYRTPTQNVEMINNVITQIYAPLMQMMMAQGGTIDFAALNETYADHLDNPLFRRIIKFQNPSPQLTSPGLPDRPTKAGTSTRNYVRKNVSTGGTPQARAEKEQQSWLAASRDQ